MHYIVADADADADGSDSHITTISRKVELCFICSNIKDVGV